MPKLSEPAVPRIKKPKPKPVDPIQAPKERPVKYPKLEGKIGWLSAEQARGIDSIRQAPRFACVDSVN